MTTPVEDPILGPLLQKSEAFQQQLSTAISAAASRNKELESQFQSKIATLERELERSNVEIEKLKVSKTSADQDLPPKGFFPPSTPVTKASRIIDGVEYVPKDEYNKLLKSLHHTGKKYHTAQQKLEHLKGTPEAGKGTPQVQLQRHNKELSEQLQMEKLKVDAFEKKLETLTQLLELTQVVVKSVLNTNADAIKRYKKYNDEDDRWRTEMLEKGAVTASDFERRPSRDPWPNIAVPLRGLSKTISENNIMRTRGQSMPPPGSTASTSTPCPPARLPPPPPRRAASPSPIHPPTQDPDATSDEEEEEEEPESALLKFSPTSRAIMRKPGSETLAVLHPEPFSPIENHHDDTDWEITEDALVNIKSEPVSEPDWYSKYGYSRLVSGEQETFDLDNITAPRQGSAGPRSFGQVITTPERNNIRSPFLTQSSLRTRSTEEEASLQPAIPAHKPAQSDLIEIIDSAEEVSVPLQTPADASKPKGNPTSVTKSSKPSAMEAPPKPKPLPEQAARTEVPTPTGTGPRKPLGEIPDPNGLPEPSTMGVSNLQPTNRAKRLGNIAPSSTIHDKENPPTTKKLAQMLSTPTQNDKLPPTVTRSAGAVEGLKLKRRSLGPLSAKLVKKSSLVFPTTGDQATAGVEIKHTTATPGEKRPPETLQGSSHKKKQRVEERSTTPPTAAAAKKPDNPFSPSKYRINPNKNDGLDFAFGEVVRDKARKDCLPKCVKECCRDLASGKLHEMWKPPAAYQAAKFSAVDSSQPDEQGEDPLQKHDQYKSWNDAREKSERNLEFGRHRAQHQKAAEVMGYWESDFPTTQQLEEQKVESDRRYMEKGFERYEQATKGGMYERRD
ncbi:hypothetical protein TWF281_004652 [Arthrobotrys megalospora]